MSNFRLGVFDAVVSNPTQLTDFVESRLPQNQRGLSPSELIELGSVYVDDQRILKLDTSLKFGQRVRVHASPRRFSEPEDLRRRIVSETSRYLVVDKPTGVPVEPTVDNFKENLISFLGALTRENLYPVHSLEIDDQGLVIVAKSEVAARTLKADFANGEIARECLVLTEYPVPLGQVAPELRVSMCEPVVGSTAVVNARSYQWLIRSGEISKFYRSLMILTGRPSLLRVKLAELGAPVLGDLKNGSPVEIVSEANGQSSVAIETVGLMAPGEVTHVGK